MKPYKNLKTVFISNDELGTSFSKLLSVTFNVDEIIVRSYTYREFDANTDLSLLSSNLVNGPLLCQVVIPEDSALTTFVNTQFPGPGIPIQGEYSFNWSKPDLTSVDRPTTFRGDICIQMIFIEY